VPHYYSWASESAFRHYRQLRLVSEDSGTGLGPIILSSTFCVPKIVALARSSVADPHHFDADPDPDTAYHFHADPDPYPTCHLRIHANPDPQHWLEVPVVTGCVFLCTVRVCEVFRKNKRGGGVIMPHDNIT
jgi:hypothetical protein